MWTLWALLILVFSASHSKPKVFYEVKFDETRGDYLYTYEVVNSERFEEIILFSLYPLAPVYEVKTPDGWSLLIKDGGRIVWTAKNKGVKPGESFCCFSLRSRYDGTLSYSEVRGEETLFIDEAWVPGNREAKVVVEANPLVVNLKQSRPRLLTLYIRIPPELKGKEIDPKSLFFQGAKPLMVRKVCEDTFMARFDLDYLLLSFHFTRDAYLWGKFRDGTPFLGFDWVLVEEDKEILPLRGSELRTTFKVSSSFSLVVNEKDCRVDLAIPEEAHRVLLKSFGNYEVYTEFPGVSCENLKAYTGKDLAPWVAFADINGDGRKDAFLRILTGNGRVKKVVELFLVSSGNTFEVQKIWEEAMAKGRPKFYGRPKEVLSPCKIAGALGSWGWSMKLLFKSDCISLSLGSKEELATFYYIYLNGRVERVEYVYEP